MKAFRSTVSIPLTNEAKRVGSAFEAISQIRRQISPNPTIGDILFAMVDKRASITREIISLVEATHGDGIRIFGEHIHRSVRAAETNAKGVSIFAHDPNGKVAACEERAKGLEVA